MVWTLNRVCQGDKTPKKDAAPSDNTCCPINLPKKSLQVQFGTFTFQVCLLAKRQQFSHTIIWKAKFTLNSVDFNPEKGQALGRIHNFCPVDGKAKGTK